MAGSGHGARLHRPRHVDGPAWRRVHRRVAARRRRHRAPAPRHRRRSWVVDSAPTSRCCSPAHERATWSGRCSSTAQASPAGPPNRPRRACSSCRRTASTPDPYALLELGRDLRPPDYASGFVHLAVQGSPLDEPITVSAVNRPAWLHAVATEPGVTTASITEALAIYSRSACNSDVTTGRRTSRVRTDRPGRRRASRR